MKRLISLLLAMLMLFGICTAYAESDEEDVSLNLTPEEIEELFGDPDYLNYINSEDEDEDFDQGLAEGAANDLTDEERAAMEALAASMPDENDGEADVSALDINTDLPSHVVNILLLGIDNRTVGLETGRSDAMIICSINTRTGSVKLTSFARDTAVSIPGYKSKGPINTAFKFGSKNGDIEKGAILAMRTVNKNFNMNIQYYVVANIYGLAAIIEALGGVDIYMTKGEAKEINYQMFVYEPMNKDGATHTKLALEEGIQHLDGMQATTYGRIRHRLKREDGTSQNDVDRNERQRKMLAAIVSKAMEDMDVMKLLNLVETFLPYGKTNMTLDTIMTLGMAVLSGDTMKALSSPDSGEGITSFGIPMDNEYGYHTYNGKSCVYISTARYEKTMTEWFNFLYDGEYAYSAK